MKIEKLELPEKMFGMETGLLVVFLPLLGLVLVILMTINLVFLPKIDDYNQMNGQLADLNSQTQQLVQKRNYLLSIDPSQLKKNSDFIVNALLPQKNSYLMVGMVGEIADNYGFQIDSFLITPGDVASKDNTSKVAGVSDIPITLSLVGPSGKYLDLIKGLESSLPIFSLQSFKMENDGDSVKMDLTISAYYVDTNSTIDISKLTLADLTMTKDESDLITELNQFTVLGSAGGLGSEFDTTKSFVKYNRPDPFNP